MRVLALSFRPSGLVPGLQEPGIAISLVREMRRSEGSEEEVEVTVIYGACRLPKSEIPEERTDVLRGIVLTAVDAANQFAFSMNPSGSYPGMLFEDDVQGMNDDWTASFACDVDMTTSMAGPFLLHGSLFGHVSNVVWADRP